MSDLKQVQQITVSLLQVFMELCDKHNLRYYFTGGSLIGVLRHKGFIPWDDDVDIGMPRRDYARLMAILKEEMPENCGLCNRHTDSSWHFNLSQFVDLQTEIQIDLAEQPRIAHVWLDIFPLDGLPSNKLARWFHVKNILLHRYLVQIAHISTQVDSHRSRPKLEQLVINFCKIIPVGKILNSNKILSHMEKILCKFDYDQCEYVGNMLGRYREREVVPKKYFGTPVKGEFEGVSVNIPEMSHQLQTHLYGDYMQLPPEKDQVAHNVKILKTGAQ